MSAITYELTDPWKDDPFEEVMVTTGYIELVAAYRRGKGRCQICFERVDLEVEFGPLQPTVDHVVPRCQGGGDERVNLQIAHKGCNSRKGGR